VHIVFQQPIVDLRGLVNDTEGNSPPKFPRYFKEKTEKNAPKKIVRINTLSYFGWADKRPVGGTTVFPDEWCFYSAHNAIKFAKGLGKKAFDTEETKFQKHIRLIRRMFISSGNSVSTRTEFTLTVDAESSPLKLAQLSEVINRFVNLGTIIQSNTPNKNEFIKLLYQGQALADHYALATSRWSKSDYRLKKKLVRPSRKPILVVKFGHGEIERKDITSGNNQMHFRLIDKCHTNGADLWYGPYSKSKVPCWLMSPGTGNLDNLRSLHLFILRLHAEIEILHEVLDWLDTDVPAWSNEEINNGPDSRFINFKRLRSYFEYVKKNIFDREKRGEFDQPEIVTNILKLMELHSTEEISNIRNRFTDAYSKVDDKIKEQEIASPKSGLDDSWRTWIKDLKPQPDLTVVIQKLPDNSDDLLWSFNSGKKTFQVPNPVLMRAKSSQKVAESIARLIENAQLSENKYYITAGIGLEISEWIPPAFWDLLEKIKKSIKSGRPTILILTDEFGIPWELAKKDDSENIFALAALANVSRWKLPLEKNKNKWRWPPSKICINSAISFKGEYNNDRDTPKNAEGEIGHIEGIFKNKNLSYQTKVSREIRSILLTYFKKIECKNEILHFALHGKYIENCPTDCGILIADKDIILPVEITAYHHTDQTEKYKTFIFLNACSVGRSQETLTKSVDIAFLQIGASASLAPLWKINEDKAFEVAKKFYDAANDKKGVKVAELFSQFFESFYEKIPEFSSTTYLAYRFYGHPALQLVLSEDNNVS
jgi:hypothetical protein